ncbi:MAG: TRAP transporter small permease subunit [Paracoccaceae bacterium]
MHIRVDVLDEAIGAWGRFAGDVLTRGLAVFVLVKLALRSWRQAGDALEFGDATNMLSIPLWPFYGLIVLGAALYAPCSSSRPSTGSAGECARPCLMR